MVIHNRGGFCTKTDRIIILLLAVSLLINLGMFLVYIPYEQRQVEDLVSRTNSLNTQNMQFRQALTSANLSLQGSSCSLDFYRSQMGGSTAGLSAVRPAISGLASMAAPAVSQSVQLVRNGPYLEQILILNGSVMNVSVTAQPGRGRVLVETTPLMGIVFQDAANTAVAVAQNRSRADLGGTDILFSIQADKEIPAIDGPSAGALITLLTIAVLEHRTISPGITLTGTIDKDGNIGAVGGVYEKSIAAKKFGISRFFIPRENNQLTFYDMQAVDYRGYPMINYVPRTVEAQSFIQQNVGISAEYVDTIDNLTSVALQ